MNESVKSKLFNARAEMWRDTESEPVERVAGMFPLGFVSCVASAPGAGKTWLMQYLACQLSCGGKILNGLVPNSPKYKSVIFAGETGRQLLDQRLGMTDWGYYPENIIVYEAVQWAKDDVPYFLNTPQGRETIQAVIEYEKPRIFWVDTLISFLAIDESKMAEMTAIFQFLVKLAHNNNCAVVINHHTRKKPRLRNGEKYKDTADDVIGSSAGIRLANNIFIVSVDNVGEEDATIQTVSNPKSWLTKVPPFTYQIVRDEHGKLDFAISFDVEGKNIFWSIRERVMSYIRSMSSGAFVEAPGLAYFLQESEDNVRSACELMVKRDFLEKITIAGKKMYRVR